MAVILAFDTSTHACSAALSIDGVVDESFQWAPQLHGALILPMIKDLLHRSDRKWDDIDAIAFGAGPGSFTGVRLAASVAQGLAMGTQKPLIAVSSLMAMADAFYRQLGFTYLACAFDARMGEVYWGTYEFLEGKWAVSTPECVVTPENIPPLPEGKPWVGVGEGWGAYPEKLSEAAQILHYYPRAFPRAGSVARLAEDAFLRKKFLSPEQALPTYIRNQVANK